MLSASNLKDLDEAGLRFIVGSRTTKAPGDLASHFRWHGDAFTDGQIIDTITAHIDTAAARAANDASKKIEPVWDPAVHTKSWPDFHRWWGVGWCLCRSGVRGVGVRGTSLVGILTMWPRSSVV